MSGKHANHDCCHGKAQHEPARQAPEHHCGHGHGHSHGADAALQLFDLAEVRGGRGHA